jgi:hypothetical protein
VCDASSPCNELATSCPADCCVCGDGVCSGGPPCNESVASCGVDCCVCGDGVCARESPCYESPSSCPGDCPLADLVVPALETVGANTVTSDGGVQVPIRVVIRNQGGAAADIFKVSTEYAGYSGTFALPFSVAGQDSSWYPYSEAALAAGGELAFEGTVTFSYAWDDEIVSLWASADSCAGEEFAAAYCRVLESNEDNNQSGAISVDIRAPVIYNILTDPEAPVEGAPLSIVASISDGSEVDRAELWYTYIPNVGISVEGYVVVPMERVDDLRWRVVLGPFDAGELRYGIAAWDEAGNNSQTNKIIVQVQYIVD